MIGGVERHVALLSSQLALRGHEIIVGTTSMPCSIYGPQKNLRLFHLDGLFQKIPFLYTDQNKRFPPPIADPILSMKLETLIREEKPDIVHTHGWILHSLLAIKKQFKVPIVTTLHGYDLLLSQKKPC